MKWYKDTARTIIMYYSIFVVVSLNIINELIFLYRNTVYFTTECEQDSSNSETFVLSKSEKILSSSSCMCFHIHWWMQQRNEIACMPLIQSIIHLTNRYCIYCTTTTTMDETISSNSTLAPNEEASTINWDVHIKEIIVFAAGVPIVVFVKLFLAAWRTTSPTTRPMMNPMTRRPTSLVLDSVLLQIKRNNWKTSKIIWKCPRQRFKTYKRVWTTLQAQSCHETKTPGWWTTTKRTSIGTIRSSRRLFRTKWTTTTIATLSRWDDKDNFDFQTKIVVPARRREDYSIVS